MEVREREREENFYGEREREAKVIFAFLWYRF